MEVDDLLLEDKENKEPASSKWKLSRKVDDDKNDSVASNGMTMVKTFGFCLTYACEIPVPIFWAKPLFKKYIS